MNNILIQLTNTMNGWNKVEFIKLLKVDLEHFKPEIFNGKHYTKKLYGDDLFLFINKKGRLVGATIGATYQKDFENYSYYVFDLRKNRKGLEEESEIILRIPNKDRIYYPRFNKKYNNYIPKQPNLKTRLNVYKNNKVKNVNSKQVENMLQELITIFTNNLFNKDYNTEKFSKVSGWSYDIEALIKNIASLTRDYKRHLDDLEREKNYYKKTNTEWTEKNSYSYKDYIQTITEINDWYKILKSE